MKSVFISNEQLLRLFRLLNKLSTHVIDTVLGRQWFKENFANVSQFCQRKKIELKAQFRELSLYLRSDGDMPFIPIWEILSTRLDIDGSNIDAKGAKYLSEALRENTTLNMLSIFENNIGTEGAKYVSEALRENTTLTFLGIQYNNIGGEGAKYLSEVLRENTTLTRLDIGGNNIGGEGVKYLSDTLRENTTLTDLYVGGNDIGREGAKYFSEALRENTTLTHVNIDCINIGSGNAKFRAEIDNYLSRNISKRNTENMSNASSATAPVVNSALKVDPQRTKNSLEYLISMNQTFIAYGDTHLKENTLLFILYMQSRRMEMQLFPSASYCLYPSLERMTYFIVDDSSPMANCSHVFCQTCIEQWNKKSCPVCRAACRQWKPLALAEHLIWQLHLQCPFECGWTGTYFDYHTSHHLKCPNEVGKCSICHSQMKRSEFFNSHGGNCFCSFLPCEYCHYQIPSQLLATHVAHECALAPSICSACGISFSTWKSMIRHVEKDCKVVEKCPYYDCGCTEYIERGLLPKHELEVIKEHVYLVKQNMTARLDKMTGLIHSLLSKGNSFC
eukprot:jgi/Galph1/5561/GphlegSOOS_G4234.1